MSPDDRQTPRKALFDGQPAAEERHQSGRGIVVPPLRDEVAEEIGFRTVGIKYVGITKTPTTFMNGHELPAAYQVKDLVPLVPGLVEAFGSQYDMNTLKANTGSTKIS